MARRRQEVQLQQEIETQEEWEDMLSKEGVYVIDVYQEWCGPCAAMMGNFRKMKNELGDDLLKFAVAKADTIDALDRYRGRCEPCFMFVAGGMLVAIIRGCNVPLITKTVTEQLTQEHKVLDGTAERKEVRDTLIVDTEEVEKAQLDEAESEKEEEGKQKEVTVAIIKPDAVKAGIVDEITEQMKEAGIEILAEEERQLTEDEAREFYSHLAEEEYFEELVQFMCSGPSHVLVLTKGSDGQNIIQEWRDLIGPTSVEEAKETAPNSLRARYGSNKYMNALHGSSSPETSARELAFFYPSFTVPSVLSGSAGTPPLQRTIALIRPDAFRMHKDAILEKIKDAGFKVAMQKEVQLTKEQAAQFYHEHQGQEYFDTITERMSSGPLLALGIAREDAIDAWRTMIGPQDLEVAKSEAPECLRAQFSIDEDTMNQLHGSDSEATAQREWEFFFPMEQTIAAIKPDAYGTKDEIIDKIHEAGFRIAARKETQLTREMAEQFYADQKDKDHFEDLVSHMISGPTYFMVLSREEAVSDWRSLLGPTNPDVARENDPESIRALFGKNVKENAVHGSSNPEQVQQSIKAIFGELQFNPDGSLTGDQSVEKSSDEVPADQEAAVVPPSEQAEQQQEQAPAEDHQASEEAAKEGDDEKATEESADDGSVQPQPEQTEEKTEESTEQSAAEPADDAEQTQADIDQHVEQTEVSSVEQSSAEPGDNIQQSETTTDQDIHEQTETTGDPDNMEQMEATPVPDNMEQRAATPVPDNMEQREATTVPDNIEQTEATPELVGDNAHPEDVPADTGESTEPAQADAAPEEAGDDQKPADDNPESAADATESAE